METVDTSARLAELRKHMKAQNVDVYIVPSEDSHHSEYTTARDARRAFISGFTGSAGCAVITHDKAALSTDGRYFNQASKQLDSNWTLLKQGLQDVPTWQEWSADEASGNKVVGVDPLLLTSAEAERLSARVTKSGGSELVAVENNLVDQVWGAERPSEPKEPVKPLDEKYTGKGTAEKLADLRKELEKKNHAGFVVSMLDEIAWLFNLRGNDIQYNPVFFSYATVTADSATLYMDASKLSEDGKAYLTQNKVDIKPYEQLIKDAKTLRSLVASTEQGSTTTITKRKTLAMSTKGSWSLKLALGGKDLVDEIKSPVEAAKAIKTEVELEGMRQCHIRDGAALSAYFAWLEDELINKSAKIDEVMAADKLEEFRSKQNLFVGLSFDTISSTGANAAVMHYKPERGSCAVIDPAAIYLCDSGAQYLDGTTDTTRTLHLGTPTYKERLAYTKVLQGNIALDLAIFPKGTTGFALDALARQYLWHEGLDYRHGTGHGVGSYLNVHEGPFGIGTRKEYADVPLAAGNVTSIEPGYYEDGAFGIRIENMALVGEVETKYQFGDKPYLGFEHVTMVPYCRKLILVEALSKVERKWIDDHHAEIYDKTSGLLQGDALATAWLKRETQVL